MQALHGVVPARFERRCDQSVAGIDRLVAPFGEFGVIARALDPHPPLGPDAAIPFFQIGQRREREFDRHRGDGADQPLADGLIEGCRRRRQTSTGRQGLPMFPNALIERVDASVPGVANPETASATPAEEQALQEAEALSRGTGKPFGVRPIRAQTLPVGDELIGGDIGFVVVGDHNAPGILRHQARSCPNLAGRSHLFRRLVTSEHIGAGVGRIGKDAKNPRMGQSAPEKFAVPRAAIRATREA